MSNIRIEIKADLKNVPKKTRVVKDENGNNVTLSVYDLSGADLEEAELEGVDLIGADLTGANLTFANLNESYAYPSIRTDLTGADLTDANLRYAKLKGAFLTYANLTGADLTRAYLEEAELEGAELEGANLTGANLRYANLRGADLTGAHLTGADLTGAYLREAILTRADLTGADLTQAYLEDANLTDADLTGAYLEDANLTQAVLINAVLIEADFTGANLTGTNLTGANLGENLTMAIGINVPRPVQGVAFEIHNKSNILTRNSKFIETIEADTLPKLESFNYDEIQTKFVNFININENFKDIDKPKLVQDLTMVINKAKQCDVPQGDNANIINKAINFAFNQDIRFIEAYIGIFIDETSKAYTDTDPTSCVAGIRERFYTSLLGAALQVETIEDFTKTPQIKTLYCIASTGNIQKDPNELIQMWSESWKGRDDEWKKKSVEDREKDFKDFMLKEYKDDDCYAENQDAIVKTINTKADEIEYVFSKDVAAEFGGSKHNNKIRNNKSKKIRNPAKNKKNKTKKTRHTKKVKQTGKRRTKRK